MILADTSVWVDNIRRHGSPLTQLLASDRVLMHPFVVGEIAMGNLARREAFLRELERLPEAVVASHAEVLQLVGNHRLFGRGIGYIDAHLLASVRLTPDARLWSLDRRLADMAGALGVGYAPP